MAQRPVPVLFCEHNADGTIGGSYYSLLFLVAGLDRTRYAPVVVFYSDHALLEKFRNAGAETLVWRRRPPFVFATRAARLGPFGAPLALLQKALNLAQGFAAAALHRAWFLRRRGIRLVHLNNSILYNHDWMLGAMLARVPCVTHERGMNAAYPWLARALGRRLGAVLCISGCVRDNVRTLAGDLGNLRLVHNGLDPDEMRAKTPPAEMRRAHGLDETTPVVVMTGNIREWKGQEVLIRAMGVVRRSVPAARCFIVGDTGPEDLPYDRRIRGVVAALGLGEHVVFTGYRSNVADYLTMSDVVVHASIAPEPFGRVVLEAMACRKPLVGSRAGAIPEIVVEGETGLMFPPGDHEALAAAIVRLLGDPAESRRLGEQGYERLVREFHLRSNLAATERIYEELIDAAD